MTLEQLQIFQAIVRNRSITNAARTLRISQPVVSKQLGLLEKEFGVRFHVHVGQGIELTEEGVRFGAAAEQILEQSERLKTIFTGSAKPVNTLKVGASQSPSALLAPAVLKVFGQLYPNVCTVLRAANSQTLERLVANGEIEIALITVPSNQQELVVEPISSQGVAAFVYCKHPLAKQALLKPDELGKVPCIIKMGGRIEKLLKQQGLHLNIAMQCESASAVKSAVESGLGIGLLPRDNVEHGLSAGYFKAIKIAHLKGFEVQCFVIYRKGMPLSPDGQNFLALLRRWSETLRSKLS